MKIQQKINELRMLRKKMTQKIQNESVPFHLRKMTMF